jgi:hypothetical protein
MTDIYDKEGKLNYALLLGIFAISATFLLTPIMATQVSQEITLNGTGNIQTGIQSDNMSYENIVYIDGEAYLTLTFDDGSEKIVNLENYVASKETDWTTDGKGASMDEVVSALNAAARYKLGQTDYISEKEQSILDSLEAINRADLDEYLSQELNSIHGELNNQQKAIQANAYEIESLYRTLEKTNPNIYCQSRMEVVKKYDLPSVKCGLHSKRCYNGNEYTQENGRDFCIHTEAEIDYIPCYNTFGRCGTLNKVEILESEVNSYTPVKITFTNPGNSLLQPNVTLEVRNPYTYEVFKTYTQDLGDVLAGETKEFTVYLDNSGLTTDGNYEILTTVQSGRKEVLDNSKYQLKPEGTFLKSGTLTVAHSEAGYKKEMQITGTFTNTADNSYPVVMTLDVFLDGKRYTSVKGEPVAVKPGESKDLVLTYRPDAVGNYTVQVKVIGTELKESFAFEIVKPTITGMFVTAVAKTPENELANAENTINSSSMTMGLGALALVFCVVSTLVYWNSSKAGKAKKTE